MAFNPFHSFRKHQKAIFAVLTIVCMFVFILSFGPGDMFSRGRNARERGELVTTLYGRKVYQGDMSRLRNQRRIANAFMYVGDASARWPGLAGYATSLISNTVTENLPKVEPDLEQVIRPIYQAISNRNMDLGSGKISLEESLAQIDANLRTLANIRLEKYQAKPETKKIITDLTYLLEIEAYHKDARRKGITPSWFGGGSSPEDLLDFMIWRHQADRLGINLTEIEVIRALNAEAGNQDNLLRGKAFSSPTPQMMDLVPIFFQYATDFKGYTPLDLLAALTDELRVAMAKEALLGESPGFLAFRNGGQGQGVVISPAAPTPEQYYDFFRKELTSANLALLDIPVADFLSQVKKQPAEEELERLFKAHKGDIPTPFSDQPGFKEPRKVREEYIRANVDLPAVKTHGKLLALRGIVSQLAAPVNPLSFGVFPAAGALTVAEPILNDPLVKAYERYENHEKNLRWFDSLDIWSRDFPGLRDYYFARKETLASAVGLLVGSASMPTPAGVSPLPTVGTGIVLAGIVPQEAERKLAAQPLFAAASFVGALSVASVPGPVVGNPLFLAASFYGPKPVTAYTSRVLSHRDVASVIFKQVADEEGKSYLHVTMLDFYKELSKIRSDPDKARKYVDETIKKLGLEKDHWTMAKPEDRYAIVNDPTLQPLKKAFDESPEWGLQPNKPDFADIVFDSSGLYEPILWSSTLTRARYRSQRLINAPVTVESQQRAFEQFMVPMEWERAQDLFVIWRTEETREREPASLKEVRDQVEKAWKRIAARELARKKAAEITAVIKEKYHDSPKEAEKFLKDQKLGRVFEMDGVARLVDMRLRSALMTRSIEYRPYEVLKADIEYPRPNFVERVMALDTEGDSTVVSDRPQNHFYVTVVLQRRVPSRSEFLRTYAIGNLDPLWSMNVLANARQKYEQEVMRELRVNAAGKVNADGQLILPTSVTKGATESAPDTGD